MADVDINSVIEGLPTRAAKIRALAEQGLTRKEIAAALECTPQQIYSALKRGKKEAESEIILTDEQAAALETFPTNAAKARYLGTQGLTTNQIAKYLGISYQQVYRALKGKGAKAEEAEAETEEAPEEA